MFEWLWLLARNIVYLYPKYKSALESTKNLLSPLFRVVTLFLWWSWTKMQKSLYFWNLYSYFSKISYFWKVALLLKRIKYVVFTTSGNVNFFYRNNPKFFLKNDNHYIFLSCTLKSHNYWQFDYKLVKKWKFVWLNMMTKLTDVKKYQYFIAKYLPVFSKR